MNRNKQTTEIKIPKMTTLKNYDYTKNSMENQTKNQDHRNQITKMEYQKGLRSDKGSTEIKQNNKTTEFNDRKRKKVS